MSLDRRTLSPKGWKDLFRSSPTQRRSGGAFSPTSTSPSASASASAAVPSPISAASPLSPASTAFAPTPSPSASRRRGSPHGSRSPSKSSLRATAKSASGSCGRGHHRCLACDRILKLRELSDPHTLATIVVNLEAQVQKLQETNSAMSEQLIDLEMENSRSAEELSTARHTIDKLEVSIRDSMKQLLTVQIQSEAKASGVKDPKMLQELAKAESPRRLGKALETTAMEMSSSFTSSFTSAVDSVASGGALGSPDPDVMNGVVSRVVNDLIDTVDRDTAKALVAQTSLEAEVRSYQEQLDEVNARLRIESQRREEAEGAYKFLLEQTAPLRLNFTKVKHDARREVKDHARALELNAAVCAEFARTLRLDIRKHFGFVPLHITNKIEALIRGLVSHAAPELAESDTAVWVATSARSSEDVALHASRATLTR